MNQRSVSCPTPRPLLVRVHGSGFRCTRHVSLQRCHDMASPSLHGVPRDGSPASAILWDAPNPRRPSRPVRFFTSRYHRVARGLLPLVGSRKGDAVRIKRAEKGTQLESITSCVPVSSLHFDLTRLERARPPEGSAGA